MKLPQGLLHRRLSRLSLATRGSVVYQLGPVAISQISQQLRLVSTYTCPIVPLVNHLYHSHVCVPTSVHRRGNRSFTYVSACSGVKIACTDCTVEPSDICANAQRFCFLRNLTCPCNCTCRLSSAPGLSAEGLEAWNICAHRNRTGVVWLLKRGAEYDRYLRQTFIACLPIRIAQLITLWFICSAFSLTCCLRLETF